MDEAIRELQERFDRLKGKLSPEEARDMQSEIDKLKAEKNSNDTKEKDKPRDFKLSSVLYDMYKNSKAQTATPENTDYIGNLLTNIGSSSGNAVESFATGLVQTTLGGIGDYINEQSYL